MPAPPSRAGRWLWFVHADSRLPAGWFEVFAASTTPSQRWWAAASRSGSTSTAWQARCLERRVALRVRWFGLPYGDQGIFVRRGVFTVMHGFAPLPLMEDVEFVRRLKRHGQLEHLSLAGDHVSRGGGSRAAGGGTAPPIW